MQGHHQSTKNFQEPSFPMFGNLLQNNHKVVLTETKMCCNVIVLIFDTVLHYFTSMFSAYQRLLKEVFGKHCRQKYPDFQKSTKKGGIGIRDSIQMKEHFLTVWLSLSHFEHSNICLVYFCVSALILQKFIFKFFSWFKFKFDLTD